MTVFHEQCLKLWKSALIEHVDKKQETQTSRKTEQNQTALNGHKRYTSHQTQRRHTPR